MKMSKAIVEAAFKVPYSNEDQFIKDLAMEFTIGNIGKDVEEFVRPTESMLENPQPSVIIGRAYAELSQSVETDEEFDGLQAEYSSWLKEAKRMVAAIKRLSPPRPPTIELAHQYWERKGPFDAHQYWERK